MNIGIPVIKFLFRDDFKVLEDALKLSPSYTVEEFPNASDLSTYLSTEPAGLVIASLKDKNDLVQIATFVKLAKKIAKETAVKIVVINFSGDRAYDKAIAKLGIQDVIEIGINTKALKFKLDFWMKALNAQVKKNQNLNGQAQIKSLDQNKGQDKKGADSSSPIWENPLDLEDDIWILKADGDCKKVLSRWLIRLMGPSPYIGQWTEIQGGWRFDIKESEKELYCPGTGAWYFAGDQKPDFIWKENVWMISGDNFELYYKDETTTATRLKSKDKVLTMAKNSLFAKTKEPVIIESFDKELVFKKEAESLEDLEGKNKTDQIDGGPLSGKNQAADRMAGNLSGKTEGEAAITHDNLSQKTSTARENKFWGGKNSAEAQSEDFDGPASGAPASGADLSRERKDLDHQKHYKNHNEAEKYEAGNLSGKSSTDEVPKHYDNDESRKDKSASKKEGRDYSGESTTDQIESHYGKAKDKPQTPEQREKDRKDKEEKLQKERQENAEKNKAEHAERERKLKEDRAAAKETNERARQEKEQARTKTPLETAEEDKKKYGLAGISDTEKLSAHYKNRKPGEAPSKEKSSEENESLELRKGSVLPFNKKESKSPESIEEKELAELTTDTRVSAKLSHNGSDADCKLDDFFDDTIIFSTNSQSIEESSKVLLDMMFKFEKETKLKMSGTVLTVEGDGEGNNYVTVQVSPESVAALGSFMKLYELRQRNVNEFLKRVKGL